VLTQVYPVRDAPTLDAARAPTGWSNTHGRQYPAAIGCFQDDLVALLGIRRVPTRHRIRVRTTNSGAPSSRKAGAKVIPRSP
jgi:hypothetical protein